MRSFSTAWTQYVVVVQGVPKKVGLVIVAILAPKIIFKLTPINLAILVPYIKIILSYCGGLCHEQFIFMDILVSEVSAIFA